MPSFSDFTPEYEPDYDVTPEEEFGVDEDDPFQENFFNIVDSVQEPDEPGAGDTFQGTDPTVFDEQGENTDEQTAEAVPDPVSFGQADDPEAQEQVGDEAEGDDEDDNSDPAEIDPGRAIDATDDTRFPEQGQDSDETTYKEPTIITEAETASILVDDPELFDIMVDLIDWNATRTERLKKELENELVDWYIKLLDDLNIPITDESFETDPILHWLAVSTGVIPEDDEQFDSEEFIMAEDFNTTPTLLADFGDIIGGIDQETYLNEFQFLNEDNV